MGSRPRTHVGTRGSTLLWERDKVTARVFYRGRPSCLCLCRGRSPSCSSGCRSTRANQPRAAGGAAARPLLFGARNVHARFPSPGSHRKEDAANDRTDSHHRLFDSWPKPIFLHVLQALIKQGCSPVPQHKLIIFPLSIFSPCPTNVSRGQRKSGWL